MNRHRWISIAAHVAALGAAAWIVKFLLVAATDGDGTAAAPVLYLTGVFGLLIGSTWVGATLAGERGRLLLATLVLASPFAVFVSYAALDPVGIALAGDGAEEWVKDELGILFTGALWLTVTSAFVLRPRGARRARRA